MCCIIIIIGKTGAGKSTITEIINKEYGVRTLSFAEMGKAFAHKHGQKRLRDCYRVMGKEKLVSDLIIEMKKTIDEAVHDEKMIIIDGLYSYDVYQEIKKQNNVFLLNVSVNDDTRYTRISSRLQASLDEAKKENDIKEEIKSALGSDKILEISDFLIDGNKNIDEVLKDVRLLLHERFNLC